MLLGKSTKSEEKEIKEWFIKPDTHPVSQEDEMLKQEMWQSMAKKMAIEINRDITPVRAIYRKPFRYTAVACIVLILFGAGYQLICESGFFVTRKVFANTKNIPQHYQMAGVDFILMPSARTDAVTNLCGTESGINFCGDMMLKNSQSHDVAVILNSSCSPSPFTNKKIVLKPEKDYMVFQHKYRYNETYIIDVNKARYLPPILQTRVNQWHSVNKFNL